MNIPAALVTIAILCPFGAFVIEIEERYRMMVLMDRCVAKLNLSNDTVRTERSTNQTQPNNCKQYNVHRFFSFGRI